MLAQKVFYNCMWFFETIDRVSHWSTEICLSVCSYRSKEVNIFLQKMQSKDDPIRLLHLAVISNIDVVLKLVVL